MPFVQIADGRADMPFDDFLKILPEKFDPKLPYNYRIKNWQAFELGMDHLNEHDSYVKSRIQLNLILTKIISFAMNPRKVKFRATT